MELNKKIEIARQNFRKYMFEYRQTQREVEQDHLIVSIDRLGFSVEKFQDYVLSKYYGSEYEIRNLNVLISRDSNTGCYIDSFNIYLDVSHPANSKYTITEIIQKDKEFKELFDDIASNVWSLEKINYNDIATNFSPTVDFSFNLMEKGVVDKISTLFLEETLLIKLNQARLELGLGKKNTSLKKIKI